MTEILLYIGGAFLIAIGAVTFCVVVGSLLPPIYIIAPSKKDEEAQEEGDL